MRMGDSVNADQRPSIYILSTIALTVDDVAADDAGFVVTLDDAHVPSYIPLFSRKPPRPNARLHS